MTVIAGIFSRNSNQLVPASICDSLKSLISRNPSDEISIFKDERSFFVKADIGVYGESFVKTDESGAVTLVAGEPLLSFDGETLWQSREADTALIHDGFANLDGNVLKNAQGTFCAINYQPASGTLNLIADKLGVRPIYYWVNEDYIIFAGAIRILEGISEIPKKMDVRAVTEIAGLGYPLSNRTPYTDIFLLKAAEIVTFRENEISRRNYWRWDEIETVEDSEENLLTRLYKSFDEAVARRNRNDSATVAYLSGGLDSRCIVAALCARNINVHTFNFARPQTQDQVLGLDFARKINSIHEEIPKEAGDLIPDYSALMAKSWMESKHREEFPAERSALIWSGEGGSVALGHVHLNEKIVDLMRGGKIDEAIETFMKRESIHVSPKLFRDEIVGNLAGIINDGIREEINSFHCNDPARNFYLFLMLNDQRRKLAEHFENIDLHRLELQLPFFDGEFLASIISIPLDLCLKHKLYVKWLALFHPAVTSVAWQAYPEHEPCPLPVPQGLSYQWEKAYQTAERAAKKRLIMKQSSEILRSTDFPDKILSKKNLRLASWIHFTGLRDYEYIIEEAQTYYKYWKKCGGKYDLGIRQKNLS